MLNPFIVLAKKEIDHSNQTLRPKPSNKTISRTPSAIPPPGKKKNQANAIQLLTRSSADQTNGERSGDTTTDTQKMETLTIGFRDRWLCRWKVGFGVRSQWKPSLVIPVIIMLREGSFSRSSSFSLFTSKLPVTSYQPTLSNDTFYFLGIT